MTQPPERHVYSVKEFTNRLARLFARHSALSNIAIAGEVSDLHPFGNGHVAFRLKEEQAVLDCIAWFDRRRELPELRDGMAVIATGSIGVRKERGAYQLVVEQLEPTGIGALFALYEKLKEKFRAEGLFDPARKRAVPHLPRRVALISARGEAHADFVQTLGRDASFVSVRFIETRVQGEGAEIEIAAALDEASRLDVDVVVLTRGGGSYEDLFPFNLEPVVRAIVRSRHPVVTAIGHTQDHHLADDVADLNFHTPSLAAKHLAQGWLFVTQRLGEAQRALRRAMETVILQASHRTHDARTRLDRGAERLVERKRTAVAALSVALDRRSPQQGLAQRLDRLVKLKSRIDTGAVRYFKDAQLSLERTGARLDRVDPLAPLARGYAIVTRDGEAVKDAAALRKGDAIEARFERGRAAAVVESTAHDA